MLINDDAFCFQGESKKETKIVHRKSKGKILCTTISKNGKNKRVRVWAISFDFRILILNVSDE